jgi:hypothetical protein
MVHNRHIRRAKSVQSLRPLTWATTAILHNESMSSELYMGPYGVSRSGIFMV